MKKIVPLTFCFLWLCVSMAHSQVMINEIMYNPQGNEANGEYIELFNMGEKDIDLSGWSIQDAIDYRFPNHTVIEAQDYLVICRNELFIRDFYSLNNSIKTVGNYAPSNLSNAGELIQLVDANGNEVDRVDYNDNPPWPFEADGEGASLDLIHPLADNNNVLYWAPSQIPTPGRVNSRLSQNVPPRFLSINHQPKSPTSGDEVKIRVQFVKADEIQSAILVYSVNNQTNKSLSMNRSGSLFEATIPQQPNGTLVKYAITATGANGYTLSSPAGLGNYYLYYVNDHPIAPGTVLINEIMYNNPDGVYEDIEWIELFNPTSNSIDLSHWILKDQNDQHEYRITPGTQIPAQGYLLIANERDPRWTQPALEGIPFSFSNGGDEVRLMDTNGRLISGVEYNDNTEWPWGADGEGGTLELVQTSRPSHEPNNWAVSPLGGTPGRPNAKAIQDTHYQDFDIVINELFYHPEDEEYDGNLQKEYVELYNRGNQPVDLSGWFFSDGIDFRFPQGTTIGGNNYLLVCKNTDQYPEIPNKIGNYMLQLSNGGEDVALTNPRGIVIDYVEYNDNPPWPVKPDGEGNSMELISPHADNSIAQHWRIGQPSSPGEQNTLVVDNAGPRITRIQHTPKLPTAASSEDQLETINIIEVGDTWKYFKGREEPPENWNRLAFNDSSWDSGPSGFGYSDNDDATELNDMRSNYFSVYIRKEFNLDEIEGFDRMQLGVDYDDSFVAYLNGVEIARANISGNPPQHDTFADGNHEAGSMEFFDTTAFINNLRQGTNVLALQGHNVNTNSSDFTLKPALDLERVIPAQDEGTDKIIISARVRDSDGVGEVTLHYQRLSSPFGIGLILGDWKTIRMVNDGTHGDLVAGDDVYTYTLNDAETINPREVWRYRVSATDSLGNQAITPLQDDLTRNYALFVEDRTNQPDYPTIYVLMERSVLNWLNQNVSSNEEQPCVVVIDGEVFDLFHAGGIRYRGEAERNKPKKSWRIQFAKGNRWQNRRIINLNANYQTSPLLRGESGFLEHLAFEMFRQKGYPAAETDHRRLVINDAFYGLFLNVEPYNEDFLENHGLPEATKIYQAGVASRRSYLAPEPNFDTYADKYENETGREEDIQDLIDFIESLNSTEDMKAFCESNLHIDQYIDYLALIAVVSHVDSTEKNYMLAKSPDGRWLILPDNMIHSWGEIHTNSDFPLIADYNVLDGAEGGVFGMNILRQKFLEVPEFRERYYDRLRDMVEHLFTPEHLDPLLDLYWNYLQDAIEEDAQRWNSPGELNRMMAELKDYVEERREFILSNNDIRPDIRPSQPENMFPAQNELISTRSLTLQATSIDRQTSAPGVTQWEIQIGGNDFHNPVWTGGMNSDSLDSIDVPTGILAADETHAWRMRYQSEDGVWSDWSSATMFQTAASIPPPDVQNVVVTPLNRSVRLEWDPVLAADIIRIDVLDGDNIVESAAPNDPRIRIRELQNGQEYIFTIHTVSSVRQRSPGVLVRFTPRALPGDNDVIAYYRFENTLLDSSGVMPAGQLLGSAQLTPPGAENPIPLTEAPNLTSINLDDDGGFIFGTDQDVLDVDEQLTIECYAQVLIEGLVPMVLLDRYDESNAEQNGIWRFGIGLEGGRTLDFLFNDADTDSGFSGRLHIASRVDVVPGDAGFHHYAAVIDLQAPLVSEKVKLFVDGIQVETHIINDDGISDYDAFRQDSDQPIIVGARRAPDGSTAQVLGGHMDEVRLSAGVLTPEEFLHPPTDTSVTDWALY